MRSGYQPKKKATKLNPPKTAGVQNVQRIEDALDYARSVVERKGHVSIPVIEKIISILEGK